MQRTIATVVVFLAAAVFTFAAGIPAQGSIYGNYVEARTADVYTGPCFANSEVGLVGNLAVFGWKVTKGSWQGVDLDGMSVVGVVRAHHTFGDVFESAYPVKAVMIVDSRANLEQRLALQSFAKHMAGDLLQDVVRVDYAPVELSFANNDIHSMKANLTAGNLAKITTRALKEGDQICHNEETWYRPLTKLDHAMAAYSLANQWEGEGLGTTWSSPDKRSSFIGTFTAVSE
ncbi:MAG TPA: DUF1326 domain-containing protein [Bryobacteraceae bacterium]|nr:DUF1326 domain-containing protein [Bryobacteraceae bacterium]